MKNKFLKEDSNWDELNEGERKIAEAAIEHPELIGICRGIDLL